MKFDISKGIEKIKVFELEDQVYHGGYVKPESNTVVNDIDRSSFYDSGIITVNFNYNNTERLEKIL